MRFKLVAFASILIAGFTILLVYNLQRQKAVNNALVTYLAETTARVERSLRTPDDERISVAEFINRAESDSGEIDEAMIRLKGDTTIDDANAKLLSEYLEASRRFLKSAADLQRDRVPHLLAKEDALEVDKLVSNQKDVTDLHALYVRYVDAHLLLTESAISFNKSLDYYERNTNELRRIVESSDFPKRSMLSHDALTFSSIHQVEAYGELIDPQIRKTIEDPLRKETTTMFMCGLQSQILWMETTGKGASNSAVFDKIGKCVAQVLSEVHAFIERAVESDAYGPNLPHLLAHGSLVAEWARQHLPKKGEPFLMYKARLEKITFPGFHEVDRLLGNELPED